MSKDPIDQAIDAYLLDDADESEIARLSEAAEKDEAVQRKFCDLAGFSMQLRFALRDEEAAAGKIAARERIAARCWSKPAPADRRRDIRSGKHRTKPMRHPFGRIRMLAAAAVLIVAAVPFLFRSHGQVRLLAGDLIAVGDAGARYSAVGALLPEDTDLSVGGAEADSLRALIERHAELTGSRRAKMILENWMEVLQRFVKVFPLEYKRVLGVATKDSVVAIPSQQSALIGQAQHG